MPTPSRRSFFRATVTLAAGAMLAAPRLFAPPDSSATPPPTPPPKPPPLAPEAVKAVVIDAHRDLGRVRELVQATPLLVNACWDWGGGDFETPLEAAAHTGGREIAEYLLAQGARPSLFAAAMLGQLGIVQAWLAIDPRAHEIPGPHGFTLLHCARQGGASAQAVVDWLLGHGASDLRQQPLNYVWPAG